MQNVRWPLWPSSLLQPSFTDSRMSVKVLCNNNIYCFCIFVYRISCAPFQWTLQTRSKMLEQSPIEIPRNLGSSPTDGSQWRHAPLSQKMFGGERRDMKNNPSGLVNSHVQLTLKTNLNIMGPYIQTFQSAQENHGFVTHSSVTYERKPKKVIKISAENDQATIKYGELHKTIGYQICHNLVEFRRNRMSERREKSDFVRGASAKYIFRHNLSTAVYQSINQSNKELRKNTTTVPEANMVAAARAPDVDLQLTYE